MFMIILLSKLHPEHHMASFGIKTGSHTCDEFESEMREIFLPFQGDFLKMYKIYKKIPDSFQRDFEFCSKCGTFFFLNLDGQKFGNSFIFKLPKVKLVEIS